MFHVYPKVFCNSAFCIFDVPFTCRICVKEGVWQKFIFINFDIFTIDNLSWNWTFLTTSSCFQNGIIYIVFEMCDAVPVDGTVQLGIL